MEIDVARRRRFKSAIRAILSCLSEGLIWVGISFGVDATVGAEISTHAKRRARPITALDNVREHPDQLSVTPLSTAERAEWAALVERLR
jgi:hypothetical protein